MNPKQLTRLGRLARKHVASAIAEPLYLGLRADVTRPTAIHAMVTHRCNSRCVYCSFWTVGDSELSEEMTIEQWKRAFLSLKEFIGGYFVELSGGEPFAKKDFLELPRFCHANGIEWGITTNGLAIDERRAEALVSCKPFNTNLSVESTNPEIHDRLRGVAGAHERTLRAIQFLIKERKKQGASFPIIVKPTVNLLNFRELPDLVRWASDLGVVVNMQPLEYWTEESKTLWIDTSLHGELQAVVDELLAMKNAGAPILTGEVPLSLLCAHFRRESAPREALPCRVGMRNFFIKPNGDVKLCFKFPAIGNLKVSGAREIWRGAEGAKQRRETVACEQLCLYTCLSHKTLRDKARMAFQLLRSNRTR